MRQGSDWNAIDRYGESLHSSEVENARELKFCEGCGVLLIRLRGSKTQLCPDCEAPVEIAMMKLLNKRQAAPLVAHHHRYAPLYQAIILRAVQDLAQMEHRDEAREWLLSPESDYVFSTAGISPNSIRQQMIQID